MLVETLRTFAGAVSTWLKERNADWYLLFGSVIISGQTKRYWIKRSIVSVDIHRANDLPTAVVFENGVINGVETIRQRLRAIHVLVT